MRRAPGRLPKGDKGDHSGEVRGGDAFGDQGPPTMPGLAVHLVTSSSFNGFSNHRAPESEPIRRQRVCRGNARIAASAVAVASSSVTSQGNGLELLSVIPRPDMPPEAPLKLP